RQNQPWREPIHPSSPPPKHYRQKNPIRKNKTRRKIDGFVSGLSGLCPLFFVLPMRLIGRRLPFQSKPFAATA
ncbi:hypothetical protein, partial [Rhizobium ruizarguesonis]|uniref:hypothetical protein n=1 Tax=Rhizobium ruizarguesonis TaxID=2081791 RepID=UPI0019537132